jgi:hypothetical protein
VRNPLDLGAISVINHLDHNKVVRIPATAGHRAYATGLTVHQHSVIVANAREKAGERTNMEALQASKTRLAEIVLALRSHPSRRKIERAVARYMDTEAFRRQRSEIIGATKQVKHAALPNYHSASPPAAQAVGDGATVTAAAWGDTSWDDDDDDLETLSRGSTMRSYHD